MQNSDLRATVLAWLQQIQSETKAEYDLSAGDRLECLPAWPHGLSNRQGKPTITDSSKGILDQVWNAFPVLRQKVLAQMQLCSEPFMQPDLDSGVHRQGSSRVASRQLPAQVAGDLVSAMQQWMVRYCCWCIWL